MPRADANPIARVWGIRIHGVTPERDTILKDISGIVAVTHQLGKHSERPHYHIYYESLQNIKKDTLKHVLKELPGWESLLSNSKEYTFTTSPDYTIETFWKYVWDKLKGQQLICWNIAGEAFPLPENTAPVVSLFPGDRIPEVVEIKDKRSSEEKMLKFAKFCYEQYKDDDYPLLEERLVISYLIDYSKGGFNDNAAGQYVRFAIYYICEQEGETLKTRKAYFRSLWNERVMKRFFS